jgi:hypothetical protein
MSLLSASCLLVMLAPRPASAQATPLPAAKASADAHLDARHRVGWQLGGSAIFQVVYRLRLLGHSYLEVGAGGLPEGALLNASAGLVVAFSTGTRWYPYAAGGVGGAGAAGPTPVTCDGGASTGCPWSSDGVAFGYVRAGAGAELGRHASLELDLGAWGGARTHTADDGKGMKTSSSRRFVWPMAGVACIYSF